MAKLIKKQEKMWGAAADLKHGASPSLIGPTEATELCRMGIGITCLLHVVFEPCKRERGVASADSASDRAADSAKGKHGPKQASKNHLGFADTLGPFQLHECAPRRG
jgi:hypothetical protein